MAHYQSEYGNVRQTDEYGNPVRTDEYGNPVSHTDRYGNPIPSGDTAAPYGTAGATGYGTTATTTGYGTTAGAGHHGKEHHGLGRHRSGNSSSSSSEEDEHGVRRKKGMKGKIKEKIPAVGGRGKDEYDRDEAHMSTTTPGGGYAGEHHEKKGIMDKIKEKLPGGHNH